MSFCGGKSNTCLLLIISISFSWNNWPQQRQISGFWIIIVSGLDTCFKVLPWCPFCPPLFDILLLGKAGFLVNPSVLGGLWLFSLFNSATRHSLLRVFQFVLKAFLLSLLVLLYRLVVRFSFAYFIIFILWLGSYGYLKIFWMINC